MDKIDIDAKWLKINDFKDRRGYKALRLSANCLPDLFIALDEDGFRCLMLYLPKTFKFELKGRLKEKLSLHYIVEKKIILLKLNDLNFTDIFNDLILSIYHKIGKMEDPKTYSKELISFFNKWAEFFNDAEDFKLTENEIKGLFGELFYLKSLLQETNPFDVNRVLESWKGPYETTNDFIFDHQNVEVKTKLVSIKTIRISSEYQLDEENDKGLELLIIDLKIDLYTGDSLQNLLQNIVQIIRENSGYSLIFYKALLQKKLSVENSKIYNNYRYTVSRSSFYNCLEEGFPRLNRSDLPDEITNVQFNLRVSNLESFLIKTTNHNL